MPELLKQIFGFLGFVMLVPQTAASTGQTCSTPGFYRSPDDNWCLHLSSTDQNFAASSVYCQAYGASLVTIEDEEKQYQVEQFLQGYPSVAWAKAYIGTTRILSDDTWTWYQRGQLNHTNWGADEPGNQKGYACAVMNLGLKNFNWETEHCLRPQRYICQKENTSNDDEIGI